MCNTFKRIWFAVFLLLCFSAASQAGDRVSVRKIPFEGARPRGVADREGNFHLLMKIGNNGNLFYTRLDEGEIEFSAPIRVNSIDDSAALPSLAADRHGRVHVIFNGLGPYIQRLNPGKRITIMDNTMAFYTRLNDAGDAFEDQRNVAGGVVGFHGSSAVAVDDKDNVYVFLNGQTRKGRDDVRAIHLAKSTDGGKTFSAPRVVSNGKGACGCCYMEAYVDRDEKLYFAYRSAEKGTQRDSYVFVSEDQGNSFKEILVDPWEIPACPASVYTFSETPGGTFVTWRTVREIHMAKVEETIMKITPPPAKQGRRVPVVAGNEKGETLLAWAEGTNFAKSADLRWQVYDSRGLPTREKGLAEGAFSRWGFAAAFAKRNGDFVIIH